MPNETLNEVVFYAWVGFACASALSGVFLALRLVYANVKADDLVPRWAEQSGYRLLSKKRQFSGWGPFGWRHVSRNQVLYKLELLDRQGSTRRAWLLCGDYLWGLLVDAPPIQVRWEEDEPTGRSQIARP